jgi:hypothetical protein
MTFDRARIKRGLTSNETIGPPIEEGKRYTLVIDREWPDTHGVPVTGAFARISAVDPRSERRQIPEMASPTACSRIHRSAGCSAYLAGRSLRITCPPFMTKRTRCKSFTSLSGSPSTATMSANLPASMAPIRSLRPRRSAELSVAELRAAEFPPPDTLAV